MILLAAQFNSEIVRVLVQGATKTLRDAGVPPRAIHLLWVPGAFELPVVAARVACSTPPPDAVIALGALIRGETSQHEILAHAVAQGLTAVAVKERLPMTCGVIVADTVAQAKARAGGSRGNRGAEAAAAALNLLTLFEHMS